MIQFRDRWVPRGHVVRIGHPGVPDGRRRSDGAGRTALRSRTALLRGAGEVPRARGGTRSGAGSPAALGGRGRRRGVELIRGPQRTSCFSCCAWERRTGGGNAGAASVMAGDGQGRWPVLHLRGQGRVSSVGVREPGPSAFRAGSSGRGPAGPPGYQARRRRCPQWHGPQWQVAPGEVPTWPTVPLTSTCRSPRRRATGPRRRGRARTGRGRRARSRRRSPRGSPSGWFRAGRRRPAGRSSG